MRPYILLLSMLAGFITLFNSCQKEYSLELSGTRSSGSLQSDAAGECLPKTVEGIYEAGTTLDGTENYIDVQVNVVNTGTYRIYSDTVNGFYFEAKGAFATTGLNNVRLAGNGTPSNAGMQSFIITYDSTECVVAVTTLPQGGADPAEFTLSGAPNTCLDFNLAGTYIAGAPLSAANTVTIKVNVTKSGTYDITTGESNGMTFSGSGPLPALGDQTIVLTGSGTPAVANATTISVPHGATNCGFIVNVVASAEFTVNCASANVEGTYEEGVALTAANTVDLTVDVTVAGPYSITATANGMTFTGAGTLAAGAGQAITLNGTGIPAADGNIDVQIPGKCAFQVTVDPGTVTARDWEFTEGTNSFHGATSDAALTVTTFPPPVNSTVTAFEFLGETATGDELSFTLVDIGGGIQANETYNSAVVGTANSALFDYAGTPSYIADFSTTGVTLIIKVTSHVTSTKTIEGTFSGIVKDDANANKTITNGKFKATYQ